MGDFLEYFLSGNLLKLLKNFEKMKAIETDYNGQLYRSRLEARWQVFFDAIGIFAGYEPFELVNNGVEYLPDFILHPYTINQAYHQRAILAEIKPRVPNDRYIRRLIKFHDPTKSDILIFPDPPDLYQPRGIWIRPKRVNGKIINESEAYIGFSLPRCRECGRFELQEFDDIGYGYSFSCEPLHNKSTNSNDYGKSVVAKTRFDLA